MKKTEIKAYGKVNLGLDVTGRREDGYHLVKMIMQTVDLYDVITVSAEDSREREIIIHCNNPEVPTDEKNLAYKAAARVCDRYNIISKIVIDIEKHIPAAAGMAGGSTDGAAVINAMDELFELNMSMEIKDEIAVKLGADVPFCLRKGTYLSEGIGEKLTPITDLAPCTMVIVKPQFGVSTVWAYKALDEYIETHGESQELHPDIDKLIEAVDQKDIYGVAANMGNILELVTLKEHPVLKEIKQTLVDWGALAALMSGSGPTVFGIFDDVNKADTALSNFEGGQYGKFKVEF